MTPRQASALVDMIYNQAESSNEGAVSRSEVRKALENLND